MAVIVQGPIVIPCLHVPPTVKDLKQSSLAYNLLPDDRDQPDVQQAHLQELASLIKRYNVHDKFGIHLIHRHFQVDEGNVMLGTALTSVRGFWTKPTSITHLNPTEIHGHIFRLAGSGEMQAYEYREGPTTNLDSVDPAFFQEFIEYLQANDMTNLLGLEVLGKEVPEMMCEFIMKNDGTVMLDARDVKKWTPYRFTGFALNGPGITELKGNQSHAKTVRQTHQVFTNGKIGKEYSLMGVLRAEDIIH